MTTNTTTLSPAQRFWRLLKPDQQEIRNVYIYSIFNGFVNLSLPLGIQSIINFIQGGQFSTSWILLVFLVVLGVAVTGGLQIAQLRITENLQQKIFTRAAFEFAYRIPKIKMEVLYKHFPPELMNRFFDTISVQKGLSKIIIDFSSATLQVLLGLLLLSLYNSFFIAFSLILIILLYLIIKSTFAKGLLTSLEESRHKYKLVHWLEELARTTTTFKLAGNTELPLTRTNGHVEDYLDSREGHFSILIRQYSLMVVFKVLITAALLLIGGILVMRQELNLGQFVAAEIIILLVMSSVEKLILCLETIYDVLTSLEKIGQVTDMELESTEGINISEVNCGNGIDIELDQVSFHYPGQEKHVLNELDLKIIGGETIMLAGKNGSGKSTLLQVIAGLYNPTAGNVIYQGLPKGNLDLNSLRKEIGDSLSQEQLFQGTIRENISIGRPAASFDNIQWAAANVGLNEFIKSLPQGYNTYLDPQGKRLPASIIQRLLLARSIADKPKLLILEDSFEHIDLGDAQKIMSFLMQPEHKWTIVIVSTSHSLKLETNRVAWLEEGQITKIGAYGPMKKWIKSNTNGYA